MKRLFFILPFTLPILLFAQDTHYWTQQYGSRSALLGGAVVGGVRDNSAVFYNPGALAFIDSINLSVSATGYQYDMLKLENGAGTGIDLKSGQTQIIPLMITGLFKFKKHPKHALGYAVIARHQTGIKMSARNDTVLNIIPDYNSEGKEEYIGQFNAKTGLNEQWFGLTYSYRAGKHFSLGFTNFIAYRTQSSEVSFVARMIPNDTTLYYAFVAPLVATNDISSIEFSNIRALWKIGLAFEFDWFKFGLAVTTPSVNIRGGATIARDFSVNGLNANGNNLSESLATATDLNDSLIILDLFRLNNYTFTANDRQPGNKESIRTIYKSPLSVSAGVEMQMGQTMLSVSVEWFDKVDIYNWAVPKSKEFLRPKSAQFGLTSDQFLRIREGAKSVLNYAIGIEQPLSSKINLLASIRTNNSYYSADDSAGQQLSVSTWNLYHATLGATLKKEKSDISIGFSYSFGNDDDNEQVVNMTEPTEDNFLSGETKKAKLTFRSFALVLGYTYYFK